MPSEVVYVRTAGRRTKDTRHRSTAWVTAITKELAWSKTVRVRAHDAAERYLKEARRNIKATWTCKY